MPLTQDQIKSYEDDVSRPGKFAGEARYVPYFYDQMTEGCADDVDCECDVPDDCDGWECSCGAAQSWAITVDDDDVATFPELADRLGKEIIFYERDDGFVVEC